MSRTCRPLLAFFCLFPVVVAADSPWKTQRIHEQFYTEGSSVGDLNGDGRADVVAGPFYFLGPDFQQRHAYAEPRVFPVAGYSDHFFSHVSDVDGDGDADILVIGFPGEPARLYRNPGDGSEGPWPMHTITGGVDNESPAFFDLIPGGPPEIVCGHESQYGYFQAGEDPTAAWTWHPVSRPGTCGGRFAHGMGVGDVNGDGLPDLLDRTRWWQNPGDAKPDGLWKEHTWAPEPYGGGGAQILVTDVDGDGDQDLISSHNAHGFGLSWFEQTEPGKFARRKIMGESSTDNPYGVAFSQLHALALADIDGDGVQDIVTGKRYFAHGGKDPGGLQEPVLYWFRCKRSEEGVEFVPHEIDRDSGVGTEVTVADLNADGKPDVITSSKRGLLLHVQAGPVAGLDAEGQPIAMSRWAELEGRDQAQYAAGRTPEDAAASMRVPDGFSVDLIAAEPELTQPIAMCFDARGRIWVIEGHTYPQKAPPGEGRDRIVIFADEDADGMFESRKVFAENINLASGIEVGFGGVFVGAAPELLFFPDADRDDVPDAEPTVLLDGWGYQDTHETLSAFTWGPDGWLYGCHGVFTHSKVGKPGTPEDQRQPINAGIWRYHPVRDQFEVFAHGTSNPWGVDFNEDGEWFTTACVIPHLYHVQQGARYQRQAGNHFNPYTFGEIQTIADHRHFSGNIRDHAFWGEKAKSRPPAANDTSLLGGGHAHCGLAIYNGGVFPKTFHGDLFFHNLHGHRVVREAVRRDGSGFIGHHRPDFALSQDHHQIGVGIMVGPDGALYTSDWHDPQTCHNRDEEIWDRTDGRLFRIRYGAVQPYRFDLHAESDLQLVKRLSHSNAFYARQAQRILQERAAAGLLDRASVRAALLQQVADLDHPHRLRALWTAGASGMLSDRDWVGLLADPEPYVRGWAVHFLGETGSPLQPPVQAAVSEQARQESSPVVRRYLASLAQRLPHAQRWGVLEGLVSQAFDVRDRNLPLLTWYALEPLAAEEPLRALTLAAKGRFGELPRLVIRRTTVSPAGREALTQWLQGVDGQPYRQVVLEELLASAKSRAGVEMPKSWPQAFAKLNQTDQPRIRQLARQVAVQFGDASVADYFREIALDGDRPLGPRREALAALRAIKDPRWTETLVRLMDDADLAGDAIKGLADSRDVAVAKRLLTRFPDFDANQQTAALGTLASRREFAGLLVEAMENEQLAAQQVPAFIVRQVVGLGDASLTERLESCWGKIGTSSEEKQAEMERVRGLLAGRAFEEADRSAGRALYEANCGKCHKLFGTGGDIGPEITGANRSDLKYWIENIVTPNALIGRDYQVTTFVTDEGRVVSGIVKEENEDAFRVQTATDLIVIDKEAIEEQAVSEVSLMPEGQLEPMSNQQIRELFRYLSSPSQVPLPGATTATPDITASQDLVYEGETLAAVAKASEGIVAVQAMRGFGPDWSRDHQLWWTEGKPDAQLRVALEVGDHDRYEGLIELTQAPDYARIEVQVGDSEPQSVDLYDPKVKRAPGVRLRPINIGASLENKAKAGTAGGPSTRTIPLRIRITGANPQAIQRYMVGVDRLILRPVETVAENP